MSVEPCGVRLVALGERVGLALLGFGVAALIGIWAVGLLVDRHPRTSVLASLAAFALVSVALGIGGSSPVVVFGAVAVWGLTFGGAATLLGTAGADAAGDAVANRSACSTVTWAPVAGPTCWSSPALLRSRWSANANKT